MQRFIAVRWFLGHLAIALVAACFLRLGWWQWEHARRGNTLSYGYAVQWPVFAAFGIFLWIRVVRDHHVRRSADHSRNDVDREDPSAVAQTAAGSSWSLHPELIPAPVVADGVSRAATEQSTDADLAAYNELLAWLHVDPSRRVSDYRPTATDPTGT